MQGVLALLAGAMDLLGIGHKGESSACGAAVGVPVASVDEAALGGALFPTNLKTLVWSELPAAGFSKPVCDDRRKDPRQQLYAGNRIYFLLFPKRSIMGIHLGTRFRKSRGRGGRFFCRASPLLRVSVPVYHTSRACPAASEGSMYPHS